MIHNTNVFFVCKNWTSAAIEEYYSNVYISGKQITHRERILASVSSDDQTTRLIGNAEHVKTFGILRKYSYEGQRFLQLNNKELDVLPARMPYLRKIDLEQSARAKVGYYLKELVKLHKNLKYVQEVWIPLDCAYDTMSEEDCDDYFQLCYTLRDSLTGIT